MHFFLSYSLFFVQNILVLSTAIICAARYLDFRIKDNWKFLFLLTLAFLGMIFFPMIGLGLFGLLNFQALFVVHLLLAACAYFLWWKDFRANLEFRFERPSRKQILQFLFVFAPILVLVFIRLSNTFYQVPAEYDNVAYHLPFVVQWFQSGNILDIYYSAFAGPLAYYPSNFELLDLYAVLPFGRDYLVNFLNFPLWILTGVAFYAILSQFKIRSSLATIVTALFLSMPVILRQAGVPLVDLLFTYTFLVALYFAIDYIKSREARDLFPFGFAIGIFAGTKYLGLIYGGVLAGFLCIYFLFKHKDVWLSKLKYIVYTFFAAILGGGFWYIRNWIDTGNPIFPVELNVGGRTILQGYEPVSSELSGFSLLHNVVDVDKLNEFLTKFTLMVGGGSYLLLIGFFGSLVLGFWHFLRKKSSKSKQTALIFFGLFVAQLVFFYLYLRSPYSYNNLIPNVRYALMYLIFALIAVAYVFNHFLIVKKGVSRVLQNAFLVAGVVLVWASLFFFILFPSDLILNNDRILFDFILFGQQLLFSLSLLIFSVFLLICFYVLCKTLSRFKSHFHPMSFALIVIVCGFYSSTFLIQTIGARENMRSELYEKWYGEYPAWYHILEAGEWFNENDNDAKIAYTGFNFHYHLYGRELNREVDYVNVNECAKCVYKDYAAEDASIRRDANFDNWMRNLHAMDKEYLVVEPQIAGILNNEFEWVKEHPYNFQEVFRAGETYIYKIKYE